MNAVLIQHRSIQDTALIDRCGSLYWYRSIDQYIIYRYCINRSMRHRMNSNLIDANQYIINQYNIDAVLIDAVSISMLRYRHRIDPYRIEQCYIDRYRMYRSTALINRCSSLY